MSDEDAGPDLERELLAVELRQALARHDGDHLLVAVVRVLADEAAGRHRLRPDGEVVLRADGHRVDKVADIAVGRRRLPIAFALIRTKDLGVPRLPVLACHAASPFPHRSRTVSTPPTHRPDS